MQPSSSGPVRPLAQRLSEKDFREGEVGVDELISHIVARATEAHRSEDIALDDAMLERHREAFFSDDPRQRHLINVAGLYALQGKGRGSDEGVAGDAMSLRQYTSYLYFPMNALLRMHASARASEPCWWLSLRGIYQIAARNCWRLRGMTDEAPTAAIMRRLFEHAGSIAGVDDPGLTRLIREQLLHDIMATRALLRQVPLDVGRHPVLHRITELDATSLAVYRRALEATAGTPEALVVEPAFTSTSEQAATSERHSRLHKKYKFLITPASTRARARPLDGTVDDVVSRTEREVLYPPGTAFRVTGIHEQVIADRTASGKARTHIFLEEVELSGGSSDRPADRPPSPFR